MLRTADNVFSVVLDDSTKQAGNLPAVGTVVTDSNLEEGAIVVVDAGMRRIAATTPTGGGYDKVDRYRIVQGKGTGKQLMISPMITKASATLSTSIHRVAVQQVSIVGYNGTTGTLPVAADTDFFIKIRKNDNDAANRSQPMSLFAGPVKTDATPTQLELAEALVSNGIVNFAKEPANGYLTFEMLNGGARTAAHSGAGTLTFTKGSREVVASAATASTNVVAGDLISIAAATTTAVYLVTAKDGTGNLTLSVPYQGATTTITASAANIRVAEATAAAAASGVRLTGVQADFDVNAFRDYYVNRFTVTFSDESTLITTTGARTGSGVWQQVAMDEYMSYGFEGQNDMLAVPPRFRDQAVIEGNKYGCMEISWTESIQGLVSLQGGKGSVLVYVDLGTSGAFPATQSTGEELVVDVFGFADSDFEE